MTLDIWGILEKIDDDDAVEMVEIVMGTEPEEPLTDEDLDELLAEVNEANEEDLRKKCYVLGLDYEGVSERSAILETEEHLPCWAADRLALKYALEKAGKLDERMERAMKSKAFHFGLIRKHDEIMEELSREGGKPG